jgi:dihydrodipicolinate synthase/N-acetylneuraminate lyase
LSNIAIERLAHHPKIIGIKENSANIVKFASVSNIARKIQKQNQKAFGVLAGSGSYFLPSISVGGHGAVMALANLFPNELLAMVELYKSGQLEKATNLQLELVGINQLVTKDLGTDSIFKLIFIRCTSLETCNEHVWTSGRFSKSSVASSHCSRKTKGGGSCTKHKNKT